MTPAAIHWSQRAQIPKSATLLALADGTLFPHQQALGMPWLNRPKMASLLQDFSEPVL